MVMRSKSKALMLKIGMIGFVLAVCVGAINVRQAGPKAESWPAASSLSSFAPVSTPALW
jgi:hypothetical protein